MRALRMWKIGISEDEATVRCHRPPFHTLGTPNLYLIEALPLPPPYTAAEGKWGWGLTNLDRKTRGQAQGNEIPELGEKRIADSHEVNDGGHLLTQGQGMLLTQPQLGLEPAPHRSQGVRDTVEAMASQYILETSPSPALPSPPLPSTSRGPHFCVLVVSSMGRPMSRLPSSKLGLKYSSAVMAVGLAWLRV